MNSPITPTVGRIVWFRRAGHNSVLPAIVTRVFSDNCVNLTVFEDNSSNTFSSSCLYADPADEVPPAGDSWHWMPYQVAVAKERDAITGEAKQ